MKKICNETEPENGLSHYAIGQASRIASFSRHTDISESAGAVEDGIRSGRPNLLKLLSPESK
ncbi:hypothetical protein J3P96_13625 [Pseudomonas sp. R3-56]|uniref:hypothetical protein n=1 Tax=Pseudomonas sp. R3-56 TaxID=2817401 RepID=UPI003DA9F604